MALAVATGIATLGMATAGPASAGTTGAVPGATSWDWQHCTQVLADLRAAPPHGTPLVVLLGGSAARECTISDASWAAGIATRAAFTGRFAGPVNVTACNLSSTLRSFSLDRAMIGYLPRSVPTLVYIGVNLGEFARGNGSTAFTLPRPVETLPPYDQHSYSLAGGIESCADKHHAVEEWLAQRWPGYRYHYRANLLRLEAILKMCQGTQIHPVLLDLPRDTAVIGHALDKPVSAYQRDCARLARQYDVPWVHFVERAHLVNRDFYDLFHLVEPGRVQYQRLLAANTVALLARYDMVAASSPRLASAGCPTPAPTLMADL